jgi:RNA polymerase sigma-70 factor (ECF subfamily)
VTATDQALMSEVRDGDTRQLAVLFERHHKPLFNFFVHLNGDRDLSEDLVQDVFFRMLRFRHTYDPAQAFTAWMYRIARNAGVDHARRKKPEVPIDSGSDPEERNAMREPVSTAPGADEQLSKAQELRLLRKALDRLPEEKREILILSRFQNLKYDEIAAILGCELSTVKVRVFRATRALGEIYFEMAGARAS